MSTKELPGDGYEPPQVTTLGSMAELTQVIKEGPTEDTGASFQPSVA